jgi:uncharacterized membrane protein YfcA
MEASVLFTPAFLFLFPFMIKGFPTVSVNEAIGLAITIEFFGYTSSVTGYWLRGQVDWRLGLRLLKYTVPFAVAGVFLRFLVPQQSLLIIFGVVLLGLAFIIFRAYQGEIRHTCLLCGDSLAMKFMEHEAEEEAAPGNPGVNPTADGKPRFSFAYDNQDRGIVSIAGVFAGLVGVAIGEISNTFLSVRKGIPVKVATGTAALILHITILSALVASLFVLWTNFEVFHAEAISIPWKIAFIIAPVVIVGGQIGAMINSKISDKALVRALMTAYLVVGLFVIYSIGTQ